MKMFKEPAGGNSCYILTMSSMPQSEYTVESYNTDPNGRLQQSDICTVMATSPEAAALKVLQEDLHTIGDSTRLRARVTKVGQTGNTVTTLYSRR